MQFNVIYTNNAPRTPTGGTNNQPIAGLSQVAVYLQSVPPSSRQPLVGDPLASAVIHSNGEDIGNAQPTRNPLPPGVTS